MAYTAPSITASGTTFAQFQAGGPSGHLERLIAAQAATAAPTVAATTAAGGAGHTLPAASDYYVVVTETNGFGETTASPASAGTAITLGQQLTVTYQTLQTGNTARNLYISTVSTGPFFLCATGQAAATTVLAAPLPAGSYGIIQPPTVNTTGLTYADAAGNTLNMPLQLIRAAKDGNLEMTYQWLCQVIDNFNTGQPMALGAALTKLRHAHAAFAMLATLCSEMGTLIDANPGHFTSVATGIGGQQTVRQWP